MIGTRGCGPRRSVTEEGDRHPPVEAIVALQPGMIVMTGGAEMKEAYDALTPAAPVVAIPSYETTWQASLTAMGDAVGRAEQAQTMIESLESRIEAVRATASSGPGSMFTRPAAQDVDASEAGFSVVGISPETIGEHDADLVVVPDGAFYDAAALRAQPVFQSLPAARDGRVLQVDRDGRQERHCGDARRRARAVAAVPHRHRASRHSRETVTQQLWCRHSNCSRCASTKVGVWAARAVGRPGAA
jgi:ABC-type Fe3+-hydroxamate transport system substrate-binding protein